MESYRLLEETCHMALELLGCDLAWLLAVEGEQLHSRALVSAKSSSAADVFLWQLHGKAAQHSSFPLNVNTNLLAYLLLSDELRLNLPISELRYLPDGVRFMRAFGQLRHNYIHILPLYESGTPLGLLVLATDTFADAAHWQQAHFIEVLTAYARTSLQNVRLAISIAAREAQMRADRDFLKRVLDTMGDSLLVLDEEAHIRYVNNRLLLMSGYAREELYGNSVGMLFPAEARETIVRNLQRGGRGTLSFSQQLITRFGRAVPVLMSRATTYSDGVEHTILVLSDLTEQKLREQALERQSERLRILNQAVQALGAAFEQKDVIALLLSAARNVAECQHVQLFLSVPDQADLFEVITEQDLQEPERNTSFVCLEQAAVEQATRQRHSWLEEQASTGHLNLLTLPLTVADHLIGVLEVQAHSESHFSRDEVEFLENLAAAAAAALERASLYQSLKQRANALQQAYDELREAERLKDNLLQSLSHELKTPLHKIIMQLQILDDEMYGSLNDDQHHSLRAALRWSAQLASIVDEIVIVQALSAEDLHFAAIDLERLASQAIRKVRMLAGELQLEITVRLSPHLPPVRGDERHLLTVIEQLLDNAIKFSPEGAQIELSAQQDSADTVVVCVRDHGIGIPTDQLERIFERGYQVEGGITRRFGGVGLGLAMVRRIVEAHNGRVWAESALGEGSAFYVQLPIWT
ncbi:MAG: ATP-binding protein [Anaerolineae bacterium]|nr:ATP-binding protein [Anaerolineae bacterium]MDW8298024.1 ATP-binding protein [Anaerolineae bacterium]